MLYLYHGTTSVCAVKVRIALEEKGLEWDGEVLDLFGRGDQLRPQYLALNPKGLIPTLKHGDRVITESTVIIEYLDEAFPERGLMPAAAYERAQARLWMKKIDDYLHSACTSISFAIAFGKALRRRSREELQAWLASKPDPERRELQRVAIERGVEAPHVVRALQQYDAFIAEMETALRESRYLAGSQYTLADAAVTPYVNRAAMLTLQPMWTGHRPRVAEWFDRMRERPSFGSAVTKWLTPEEAARFDVSQDDVWARVERVL